MATRITVLKSNVFQPEGKKYDICELGYKTEDGKIKGMRIFGFGAHKQVFDVAAKAVENDVLEAVFKQNEKGYWEFASLIKVGEQVPKMATTQATPARGNWETADERAARQVMIVRQSSLANAIATFEQMKAKATPQEVIQMAKVYEAYVLDKPVGEVS